VLEGEVGEFLTQLLAISRRGRGFNVQLVTAD